MAHLGPEGENWGYKDGLGKLIASGSPFTREDLLKHLIGLAWGFSRSAYIQIGGLFEYGIVGGGDYFMGICLANLPPS